MFITVEKILGPSLFGELFLRKLTFLNVSLGVAILGDFSFGRHHWMVHRHLTRSPEPIWLVYTRVTPESGMTKSVKLWYSGGMNEE